MAVNVYDHLAHDTSDAPGLRYTGLVLKYRLLLSLITGLGAGSAFAAVDFDRDVRPILSDNCFACHGPDDKARMMKLRLDTRDGLFANHVIVPGDSANSKLYQKVSSADPGRRM